MRALVRLMPLLLAAVACSKGAAPEPGPEQHEPETRSEQGLPEVLLDEASLPEGRLAFERSTSGQVVPRTQPVSGVVEVVPGGAAVLSAPTDARITKISVEPGQRVEKGQTLMHMEASAVAVARAQLARSRALRERAEQLVAQERELEQLNATSARDSTLARQELALARAEQAAAEGNLRAWGAGREGGSHVVLRAPFAAVVTHIGVEVGPSVPTGTELLRMLDPGALSVRAAVPQGNLTQIGSGVAQVVVVGSTENAVCEATMLGHVHRVDTASGSVPFRLLPSAECAARLLDGATVEVRLPLRARPDDAELVSVPAAAVTHFEGQPIVFERGTAGRFNPRPVRDLEMWAGRAFFRWDGRESAEVVVVGTILLKGELMRGQLE